MGKEAKIGLAMILVLLVVFSVVLFKRLNSMPKGPAGEVADAKAKKESPPKPEPRKSPPKGPSLSATAPKIVSARSGSDELSRGPKVSGLDDWSVVSDDKGAKKKASRNESGPPSPFPMLVGPTPQGADPGGAVSQTAPADMAAVGGYAPHKQHAPGLGQSGEPRVPQLAQRAGPFATNTLLNSVRNTDPRSPRDPYTAQDPRNPLRDEMDSRQHDHMGRYQNGGSYRTPGYNGAPRSTYRPAADPLVGRIGNPSYSQAVPDSALKLLGQVAAYCGAPPRGDAARPLSTLPPTYAVGKAEAFRNQLAQVSPELYDMLDENWGAYLGLPGEVFTGAGHPPLETLRRCLANFDTVAQEPRYRALDGQPQFQSTYGLLKHYVAALSQPAVPLNLPPPPVQTGSTTSRPSRF